MKVAAYNEDGIWGVGASADEALRIGRTTLQESEATEAEIASLQTAQITDDLVAAIAVMESGGADVGFDLEDGILVVSNDTEEEAA
jgi:hypothetical protein